MRHEGPGQRRPSIDVELVPLGVVHRDRVVVEALGLENPDERGTETGQTGRLRVDTLPARPIGTARPPPTLISRCSRFLAALRSGTTWNQIRGPRPLGSTMQSAPAPSSSSGTPRSRRYASQLTKPSGGGSSSYPNAAARAARGRRSRSPAGSARPSSLLGTGDMSSAAWRERLSDRRPTSRPGPEPVRRQDWTFTHTFPGPT